MISANEEIANFILKIGHFSIKNAVDLGCGKGRISLKLAERGIKVLGVDLKDCSVKSKNFSFVQEDVRKFKFERNFDLIVCSVVLHFLKKSVSLEMIKKIQQVTSNAGLNWLILMSDKDDFYKSNPGNFYPNLELVKKLYSGWEILVEKQDYTEIENHDNLGEHRHNLIFIVFRRKG